MFFKKRSQKFLGSKCPVSDIHASNKMNNSQSFNDLPKSSVRPASAKEKSATSRSFKQSKQKGIALLKPRMAINTYKMHQTLFNVAKDEVLASTILQ